MRQPISLLFTPKNPLRVMLPLVILVDTRKANLPKGIQETTEFQVIDHHSLESKLPAGWQLWSEAVGANTNSPCRKLMERQQALGAVQATPLGLLASMKIPVA
ncbi:MAG: hypothetical protein R2867_36790 [Caldilineaceae bacterium]